MGKGSLDYDEYVLDSSNRDSTDYQIRDCMTDAVHEIRKQVDNTEKNLKELRRDINTIEREIDYIQTALSLQRERTYCLFDQLNLLLNRAKWVLAVFSAVFLIQALLIILQACGVI